MSETINNERGRPINGHLVIDNVLTSQPELGPSIPDGGYGWIIFFATLFFQALIPSLIASFGIFLVFSTLEHNTLKIDNPALWDNKFLYVPLFFVASWTLFDPTSRALVSNSTWPRLVATGGTCMTCAGLLFLWIGVTGAGQTSLFVLSGIISGIGASIETAQCDILLAQYFRLKHPILVHIGHAVSAMGFVVAPIVVGQYILNTTFLNVVLWYQAVILQGLVLNMAFKKPQYLKSGQQHQYNYVSTNPDDEEDILSKNSRELQIKRQVGERVDIERHELPTENIGHSDDQAGNSSTENPTQNPDKESKQKWVSFEDEDEEVKFENPNHKSNAETTKKKPDEWERFEDDDDDDVGKSARNNSLSRNYKNLQLEMAFGTDTAAQTPSTTSISGVPIPLFSDSTPVNNNNTYSYDILEDTTESHQQQPAVFMPNVSRDRRYSFASLQYLREPTFYKTLVTVITTKFSTFVFYTLYPSYLYQEVKSIKLRHLTNLMGTVSVAMVLFAAASYFVNIDKKRRPTCIWVLCWTGALGYFMISDYTSKSLLLFGAVQIVLSIAALQHIGGPLLGLTVRGESTRQYGLISLMTGLAFLSFVFINVSFKVCFRLMALLNFFTGTLWLSNFIYKRLKIT